MKDLLIIGANGQLGKALQAQYPEARTVDVSELDITDCKQLDDFDWSGLRVILNAAAYTNVDGAESSEGRIAAWSANAAAVRNVTRICARNDLTLVHISSDYVFDGTKTPHHEDEQFSPLSVYGASKAAGDIAVSTLEKHYILRASWVIGEGKNFVRTMLDVGKKGTAPTVVADQIGRLTFTPELVRAIDHLLSTKAAYGTYNVTNDGEPVSWADITRQIFKVAGFELQVTDTTTAEYFAGREDIAPRPLNSALDLTKLHDSGFASRDWQDDLVDYIEKEHAK